MLIKCSYDELLSIDSPKLIPNPRNNNKHPEKQIIRLAEILKYQGQRSPILISKLSGFIVAGHGRLEAMRKAGFKEVAVNYQDFENEAQEFAHMTADNAIALWAELDLSMVNEDLALHGPELDIDLLGIENFTLDIAEKLDPLTDEDQIPETPIAPKTKKGDLWTLGNHRLLCGDSTMIDDVEKLMNGVKADIIFTDPPYNVGFNGRSGKHDIIKNDNLEDDEFNNFIGEVLQIIKTLSPNHYYIWCNWKFYSTLQRTLEYKACIVWAKNVFGLGRNYRHQHEFCLFNGTIDEEVKNESDLWQIKKDHNYIHPTQKPVELSMRALRNHKNEKNILDLFGGSGSTLIGCENMKRNGYIMELDEKYCDVIIKRWQDYTGKKAILESTGQTFDEVI